MEWLCKLDGRKMLDIMGYTQEFQDNQVFKEWCGYSYYLPDRYGAVKCFLIVLIDQLIADNDYIILEITDHDAPEEFELLTWKKFTGKHSAHFLNETSYCKAKLLRNDQHWISKQPNNDELIGTVLLSVLYKYKFYIWCSQLNCVIYFWEGEIVDFYFSPEAYTDKAPAIEIIRKNYKMTKIILDRR